MSICKFTLDNGVRVLVEPVGYVKSAAVGLWCKTGSRHETEHEAGITHLIEHMLFKGTDTRTAKEIAESIEGRGGSLNAFTDKESTCYYCRVLADDAENGIDVLSDMMLHSVLDPVELKREEKVVIEEIRRGEDEPSDHVHDLHIEHRWKNHPLGKPIIGTRESVAGFERENLAAYMERRYKGSNVMLSVAGNVDPEDILKWAEKDLGNIPPGGEEEKLQRPVGAGGKELISKKVEQVHFCIGGEGASIYDSELYTLAVMDGILGGSMSSRLFQEIREKRGLAYAIGSYSMSYSAGGAFTVYGGTNIEEWDTVQELIHSEFAKLVKDGVQEDELDRTKRNITGGIVLALEGMSGRMMRMSRNEMHHGRDIPIEETIGRVNAVTSHGIQELAERVLTPESISTTAIGPFK
jgi:predicted Zn-dependent peptidase